MRILITTLIAWAMLAIGVAEAANGIVVEHPWAHATSGGAANGAAYVIIVDKGSETDRLIGASRPIAANIQIHEEKTENGVSRMRQLDGIDLAPGSTVTLKPSGIHLMLALKQPLKKGTTFPLTLTFQKAGAVAVTVTVGAVGAMDDMSGM